MTLPGGTAPLQVRFSDSPAQKKLKIQVAAKRKIMARTPGSGGPFAFRRRSEMEEQYLYASAGPDFYMTSMPMAAYATSVPVAVAPDLAGGPLPMFGWPGTVPVMQSVAPVAVLPLQGPSFSGTEPGSPQSISDRASGTPPTSAEGGLRPDGHGRLRVPRSPSDLGQSAEISAASDDGGYDYGSGDLDELTVRVKELIAYDVENKVGSGRSLSLDGKRTGATPTGGRGDGNLVCWKTSTAIGVQ